MPLTLDSASGQPCASLLQAATHVRRMKVKGAFVGAGSQFVASAVPLAGADADTKTTSWSLLGPL